MDYWLTKFGGWEFDRYRLDFPWDNSKVRTSQTGSPQLEPLRAGSKREWDAQRSAVRRALESVLGPMPRQSGPLDAKVLEEVQQDGYRQLKITYRADADEEIPAYLLIPDAAGRRTTGSRTNANLSTRNSQLPAVICLHQTVPWGKREPCGLEGNKDLAFAAELVKRGYVCLAPDAICFGERYKAGTPYAHYGDAVAFFARHPNWSVMGKMAFDVRRAVDYLQTLPYVNKNEIGCIGHSHGAYGTLFAMLYEPRIRAGVHSCGFSALRSDPKPERWWRLTALMPRLGWWEGHMEQTPFDFHHLIALLAPRAQFVNCALKDSIFPNTDNVPWMVDQARQVYAVYNRPDAIRSHIYLGAHQFAQDARDEAYRFLDDHLRRKQ